MRENKVIKVSGKTNVSSLSGSIIKSVENKENVEIRTIGASSLNQAYKAIASARGILASKGVDILIKPGFDTVQEDGKDRTVLIAKIIEV